MKGAKESRGPALGLAAVLVLALSGRVGWSVDASAPVRLVSKLDVVALVAAGGLPKPQERKVATGHLSFAVPADGGISGLGALVYGSPEQAHAAFERRRVESVVSRVSRKPHAPMPAVGDERDGGVGADSGHALWRRDNVVLDLWWQGPTAAFAATVRRLDQLIATDGGIAPRAAAVVLPTIEHQVPPELRLRQYCPIVYRVVDGPAVATTFQPEPHRESFFPATWEQPGHTSRRVDYVSTDCVAGSFEVETEVLAPEQPDRLGRRPWRERWAVTHYKPLDGHGEWLYRNLDRPTCNFSSLPAVAAAPAARELAMALQPRWSPGALYLHFGEEPRKAGRVQLYWARYALEDYGVTITGELGQRVSVSVERCGLTLPTVTLADIVQPALLGRATARSYQCRRSLTDKRTGEYEAVSVLQTVVLLDGSLSATELNDW